MSSGCPGSRETFRITSMDAYCHSRFSGFDELFGQMVDPAEEAVKVVGRDSEHEDEYKIVLSTPVASVRKLRKWTKKGKSQPQRLVVRQPLDSE